MREAIRLGQRLAHSCQEMPNIVDNVKGGPLMLGHDVAGLIPHGPGLMRLRQKAITHGIEIVCIVHLNGTPRFHEPFRYIRKVVHVGAE